MAIVRRTSEQIKKAKITPEQKRRFDAIREEDIDYSDIPEPTDDTVWFRPGAISVPTEPKRQITVRLDSDVLQFFKGTGKKYQSRINAVLRNYMLAQQKPRVKRRAA